MVIVTVYIIPQNIPRDKDGPFDVAIYFSTRRRKSDYKRLQFHSAGIVAPVKTCTGMLEASDPYKTGTVQTLTLFWKITDQR